MFDVAIPEQQHQIDNFVSSYLPRLQLMTASTDAVKRGKCPANIYAILSGDDIDQLAAEVDVVPLVWRALAMDLTDGKVVSTTNADSDLFRRLETRASAGGNNNKALCGPQFLLWVPSRKKLVTLFLSSKTAKKIAGFLNTNSVSPVTLYSEVAESKDHVWQAQKARKCSTPMPQPTQEEQDKVKAECLKFLVPEEAVQKAPEDSRER